MERKAKHLIMDGYTENEKGCGAYDPATNIVTTSIAIVIMETSDDENIVQIPKEYKFSEEDSVLEENNSN